MQSIDCSNWLQCQLYVLLNTNKLPPGMACWHLKKARGISDMHYCAADPMYKHYTIGYLEIILQVMQFDKWLPEMCLVRV